MYMQNALDRQPLILSGIALLRKCGFQFVWQTRFIAIPLMSADTLNPNVLYAPRHEANPGDP